VAFCFFQETLSRAGQAIALGLNFTTDFLRRAIPVAETVVQQATPVARTAIQAAMPIIQTVAEQVAISSVIFADVGFYGEGGGGGLLYIFMFAHWQCLHYFPDPNRLLSDLDADPVSHVHADPEPALEPNRFRNCSDSNSIPTEIFKLS